MIRITPDLLKKILHIRLIVFDFDGVFTDNRVFVDAKGRESVACYRGDGIGLARLRETAIKSYILSSEVNDLVVYRSKKLKTPCINNCKNKLKALRDIATKNKIGLSQIAFVGNDINDIECIKAVGLGIGVSDSHPEVLRAISIKTSKKGGYGAVREICDLFYNTHIKRK
jgi:YrbI family 3-deoxy-D-manno-octulosonate 8-phosphate phosphatase